MAVCGSVFTKLAMCVTACTLAFGASAAPLTVRVKNANGAPRIVVNGQPVRARVFYGQPASAPIPITPASSMLRFRFVPTISAENATLHFRFGNVPGSVWLDDIRVRDLTANRDVLPTCTFGDGSNSFAREWFVWPLADRNTVGKVAVEPRAGSNESSALHVRISAPPSGNWPDFHIYHKDNLTVVPGHRYEVTLWARADPARDLTVALYKPGDPYVFIGGPSGPFGPEVRYAASAGVNFVSLSLPLPWPAPGSPEDWRADDALCEEVLALNPHALIIPRIPVYVPSWWQKQYPDDLMLWEDGQLHGGVASPASPVFRKMAANRLAALVSHLEKRYGEHIAGYHPCGQNTGEWFYMDSWEHPLNGYAPVDAVAFRAWLRARYHTDAALASAWGNPLVTLATAEVPSAKARHSAPAGVFRNPKTERAIIDFAAFQQASMADCVCTLAKAVRQASSGRKLVLFFYGYVFEFGAVSTGPASAGHYALRQVLSCPDIDMLCSPISYFDRGPGESAPSMTAAESVALAGKMWLNEDDTRTYLTREVNFPGSEHVVDTVEATNAELVRNVAQEATRNFATWWMDLPATGWFNDPRMWAEMAKLKAVDLPLLRKPTPFHPSIAAVIDEASMFRVAQSGNIAVRPCVYEGRAALGRTGAPYGQYLMDDVARGKVHARTYVFVNAWSLTASQRTALLRATRGSVRVWCYAPGLFDGYSQSPSAMRALTGFNLRPVTPDRAWATPTAIGRKLGIIRAFGVEQKVHPLFAAADAHPNEILATYSDGSAAVALRRTRDGASLFVGAPGLTPEVLRVAACTGGVHLFTHTDCNVYANGPFVAVHAAQDGPLTIDTGARSPVTDALSGKRVGTGPKVTIPIHKGETRVLKIR